MKLGTWNKVILKFELGNIPLPLGSPSSTTDWTQSGGWCRAVVLNINSTRLAL